MAAGKKEHHRPIRSYVRRAGRLTTSQARALQQLWPEYGLDYTDERFNFKRIFGRSAPITFEIGFGNGDTLVQLAEAAPDSDFVGVEVYEPGVGHCLMKAREAGVGNLRLVMHDAIEVLENQVPPGSLRRINLYFPDPWPKKRHHKRRIVQPAFLDTCAARLEPGGAVHVSTDWANYAEQIDDVFAASPLFRCSERREHAGDNPLDRPVTKFETRGLRHGHDITDWRFEKIDL
jgi:tRNA (guanine-N7-)-methyltransferase